MLLRVIEVGLLLRIHPQVCLIAHLVWHTELVLPFSAPSSRFTTITDTAIDTSV